MKSKIFNYFIVAGLAIMLCSAILEPQAQKIQGKMYSLDKSLGSGGFIPHGAAVPHTNSFGDYLPYIGGVSAGVGIGEKLIRMIRWMIQGRATRKLLRRRLGEAQ